MSEMYLDCPNCKQDWGMGLIYLNGRLAVECIDCGFRGPEVSADVPIMERDAAAISAWRELPRTESIQWTPAMRLAKMLGAQPSAGGRS
jgi:Zn ribbon nucleic-acid-binding protein